MKSTFKTTLNKFEDSPLWGFHFMIPLEIATQYITKKDKRVICQINGDFKFHCALMSDGKGQYFIMINKNNKKKLELVQEQIVELTLEKDNSKYGMEMPEELSELLLIDEIGNDLFHKLTPGKQRALIHLVAKNKKIETRINKALVIVDYLKGCQGKLDFKDLNIAFKNHQNI